MKLTGNKNLYLIIILVILIISGFGYFLAKPEIEKLITNYKDIKTSKDNLILEEAKKSRLEKLKKAKEELELQAIKNENLLPESKEIPDFIKFLESSIKGNGCIPITIKVTSPEGKPNISQATKVGEVYKINLEIQISGTLAKILNCLKDFDESPRIINIEFWSLKEKNSSNYTFDFKAAIYFKPEN